MRGGGVLRATCYDGVGVVGRLLLGCCPLAASCPHGGQYIKCKRRRPTQSLMTHPDATSRLKQTRSSNTPRLSAGVYLNYEIKVAGKDVKEICFQTKFK